MISMVSKILEIQQIAWLTLGKVFKRIQWISQVACLDNWIYSIQEG